MKSKRILIIGGNVEALAANYLLADLGHDPVIVTPNPSRLEIRNDFVHGPWRALGSSPILIDMLGDFDMDFQDFESPRFGILGLGSQATATTVKQARAGSVQGYELAGCPEFQAAMITRPPRGLTFDRARFFGELAGFASVEGCAIPGGCVAVSPRADRAVCTTDVAAVFFGDFDAILITASPTRWVASWADIRTRDGVMIHAAGVPNELGRFDVLEFISSKISRLTWKSGEAVIECPGYSPVAIEDLASEVGYVDPEPEIWDVPILNQQPGIRYLPGTMRPISTAVIESIDAPDNALVIGYAATGKPTSLSDVLDAVKDWI